MLATHLTSGVEELVEDLVESVQSTLQCGDIPQWSGASQQIDEMHG